MTKYEPVILDIETTGLNPMAKEWHDGHEHDAQVFAVGLAFIPGWREANSLEELEVKKKAVTDTDEYSLLDRLPSRLNFFVEEFYGARREPFFVGHNIRDYDMPYMGARFARKRLDGRPITSGWKRLDTIRVARHDDLVEGYWVSEDDYAEALGIANDDPYDGGDMPDAFANREWDKINTHVLGDVEVNAKLFFKKRERCMKHFGNHYDSVNIDPAYKEEVDL